MSLLKNRKAEDQRKAEAEAKRREEEKMRELAKHPLVKRGCDRNVRDAYLHGIIVAALADGDVSEIDADERKVIDSIARSLIYSDVEVEEAINIVSSCEDMLTLLEECVRQLPDENAAKIFACDFARVWLAKGVDKADVKELREYLTEQFPQWSEFKIRPAIQESLMRVLGSANCADADLVKLADWLGDENLKYLVLDKLGDVEERILSVRKRMKEERERKAESERIQAVNQRFTEDLERIARKYQDDNRGKWVNVIGECGPIKEYVTPKDINWEAQLKEHANLKNTKRDAMPETALLPKGFIGHFLKTCPIVGSGGKHRICWKLLVMMVVSGCATGEVDSLLRSAAQVSDSSFGKLLNETVDSFKIDLCREGLL